MSSASWRLPPCMSMLVTIAAVASFVPSCGGLIDDVHRNDGGSSPAPDPGAPAPPSGADAEPPETPIPAPPNHPVRRCSFVEGGWLMSGPGTGAPAVDLVVHVENGKTVLYVTAGSVGPVRYRVVSEDPCVLENGTGSAPPTAAGTLATVAVGDDGWVWSSQSNTLRRASPLPTMKCAIGPGYVEDDSVAYFVGPLLLDNGGKSGWGLEGPPGRLGRLTLGADACSVEMAVPPWGELPVGSKTPRDAQGRFHLRDTPMSGAMGIFTDTGTLVRTYSGKGVATDPAPFDATACAGGVCILGSDASGQSVLYLDDDGNPRAPAVPLIKGLRVGRVGAARSGAVFIVGASDPVVEASNEVVIQIAPPPP